MEEQAASSSLQGNGLVKKARIRLLSFFSSLQRSSRLQRLLKTRKTGDIGHGTHSLKIIRSIELNLH